MENKKIKWKKKPKEILVKLQSKKHSANSERGDLNINEKN